jgi:hypothetical protein
MRARCDRAAIVTTLRDASATIDSFIAYHRAVGFERLFLVFDDPADLDLEREVKLPGVTAIPHDAALRDGWRTLSSYAEQAAFVDREVMSRQILNAELAIGLARDAGMDWLLHIDADELFHAPAGQPLGEHLDDLARRGFEMVCYPNHEAIPEPGAGADFFRDVTLFRRSARRVAAGRDPLPFHFYTNGKSAVRLAIPGIRARGVHGFTADDGLAVTTAFEHAILHYACCGFDAFWQKYARLGAFGDAWWGTTDIAAAIGTFHLECRDACGRGRAAARAFYAERIELADRARADQLVTDGVAERIEEPRDLIRRTGAVGS